MFRTRLEFIPRLLWRRVGFSICPDLWVEVSAVVGRLRDFTAAETQWAMAAETQWAMVAGDQEEVGIGDTSP